ncbi:MAG TPA: MerR family transcriptional regulator [Mycobacteriales bacterium]|nr:MerR family transcriptional regulator [Mycobacteriales bacterium]
MSTFRISQLAERTGVPASTLRYYESTGLLPAERSPAGYRLYGEAAINRLRFIAAAKQLGLPLDEIAELLQVWESGACAEVKHELRPRLQARLARAERRCEEIAEFVTTLRGAIGHLDALPDRSGPCDPSCDMLTLAEERWRVAPIACSLESLGDLTQRRQDWHRVLAGAAREQIPDGIQLTVPVERLPVVAELAGVEQACCAFFDFRLHLDGPELRLQVRAPAEGQPMLAELFS